MKIMAIMRDLSYRCLSHPAANGSWCRWEEKRVEVQDKKKEFIVADVKYDADFGQNIQKDILAG